MATASTETAHIDTGMAQALTPATRDWPSGSGMIYLAMSPWQGMWKNRQQLMSRFARQMPVLYVEPWTTVRDWRTGRVSIADAWTNRRNRRIRHETDQLFVYPSQHHLPVSGSRTLGGVTQAIWLQGVRRAARRCGITRPILWVSQPGHRCAVGGLGEQLSIYHVVDEYTGYTGLAESRRGELGALEQDVLDAVDLTITVSPELADAKAGPGRDIELVENAADVRVFQDAAARNTPPDDMARVPRPRLGYSGLVGRRLDMQLLLELADSRDDWSIVLIGKVDRRECETTLSELEARDNVHFLGQKTAAAVPDYVNGFDVGMLPYQLDRETIHISPLKMYEYLAAGKPVVATDIPAARRKQDLVAVTRDRAAFIDACAQALGSETGDAVERRIREARANTWDKRVEQISRTLHRRLEAGVG